MPVIPHKIIRSSRQTFGLEITPAAELIVRVPRFALSHSIAKILKEKEAWIKRKQAQMQKRKMQCQTHQFQNGEKFLFLGKIYELEMVNNLKGVVRLEKKLKLSARYSQNAKKVLESWYKIHALKMFKKQVVFFAHQYNFQYKKIRLSTAQKRWGSCSAQNNLNFSWKLIMAPQFVLDYVIVHELVHTEEKHHGKEFWEKVAHIYPQHKEARLWLKEKGHLLEL